METTPQMPPEAGSGVPCLAEVLVRVRECRDALSSVREAVVLAGPGEMEEFLALVGSLVLMGESAEVAVVAEAVAQGLPGAGALPLTATDWLASCSPRHTARSALGVVMLAEAVSPATVTRAAGPLAPGQAGEVLGEAVLSGRASVAAANVAHSEMRRLVPDLQPECVGAVWQVYADFACGGDLGEIRRVRPQMYAWFGRPDRLNDRDERARAQRALSSGATDPVDGLVDYRLRLDAAAAAVLEAAIDPLCKPVPGPNGEPDARPASMRRADALMDLVSRGVRGSDLVPAQPATQVSLIVKLSDLVAGTGCAQAVGGVDAGRFLSIAATRALSCDAAVAPIVIDDNGDPILVGRSKRLFARAQIRALHVRDGGCTFPGCTKPAGWSDAHHLVHWIDGGETELANAALLCSYHHHVVHSRRLAGRVTRSESPGDPGRVRVVWDLTPGSYDQPRGPALRRDGQAA